MWQILFGLNTLPCRNKKPLFRAPYRGDTSASSDSQTSQVNQKTRQEFPQYAGWSTQRCSQQPTLQSPCPYRSSEDLFSSGPLSGVVDTPTSLLMLGKMNSIQFSKKYDILPYTVQQYKQYNIWQLLLGVCGQ